MTDIELAVPGGNTSGTLFTAMYSQVTGQLESLYPHLHGTSMNLLSFTFTP